MTGKFAPRRRLRRSTAPLNLGAADSDAQPSNQPSAEALRPAPKAAAAIQSARPQSGTVVAVSGGVTTTATSGLLLQMTGSPLVAAIGALSVGIPATIVTLVVAVLGYRERQLANVLRYQTEILQISSDNQRWAAELAAQETAQVVDAALEQGRRELDLSIYQRQLEHLTTVQQALIKKVASNSSLADLTGPLQALASLPSTPNPPTAAETPVALEQGTSRRRVRSA